MIDKCKRICCKIWDKIKKTAMHYWTEHKKVVIAVAVVIVIAIVL